MCPFIFHVRPCTGPGCPVYFSNELGSGGVPRPKVVKNRSVLTRVYVLFIRRLLMKSLILLLSLCSTVFSADTQNPFIGISNLSIFIGNKNDSKTVIEDNKELKIAVTQRLARANVSTIVDVVEFRKTNPKDPYGFFIISKIIKPIPDKSGTVALGLQLSIDSWGGTMFGGQGNMGILADNYLYICGQEEVDARILDSIDLFIAHLVKYRTPQ
jgi:hypothetical protein